MPHGTKGLSKTKAKKILRDGEVQGRELTSKQRGYFGAVAGGANPGGPPRKREKSYGRGRF